MKHLLAAFILVIGFCAQAQDTTRIKGITAGYPGLEFFYEIPLQKSTALLFSGGVAPGYQIMDGASSWVARPMLGAEGRWYFTLPRRNRLGMNTRFHSANYLTLDAAYVMPIDLLADSYGGRTNKLTAKFGVRRNPIVGLLLEWDFGYGLWYQGEVIPWIDFSLKLGYAF